MFFSVKMFFEHIDISKKLRAFICQEFALAQKKHNTHCLILFQSDILQYNLFLIFLSF